MAKAFDVINEVVSDPKPYPLNQHPPQWKDYGSFCETSTTKKKEHQGRTYARQTVVITFGNGSKSTTYIDHVKCAFCGHEFKSEWSNAGI